jgi:hypothetical protein
MGAAVAPIFAIPGGFFARPNCCRRATASRPAAGPAPPQVIVLMTEEHVAKRCRALALRRGGGRRGSGIGDARKGNKQGGSDQSGNNAFHDDSPQLGVGFAIAARSMAEEYRRSIRAETAKSLRDSIRKCNNQTGKRRLNGAASSLTALGHQVEFKFYFIFRNNEFLLSRAVINACVARLKLIKTIIY